MYDKITHFYTSIHKKRHSAEYIASKLQQIIEFAVVHVARARQSRNASHEKKKLAFFRQTARNREKDDYEEEEEEQEEEEKEKSKEGDTHRMKEQRQGAKERQEGKEKDRNENRE